MKALSNTDLSSIIFLLTARDYNLLRDLASQYLDFLQNTDYKLLDICYSLLSQNTFAKHKLIINCDNKEELCFLLKDFITSNKISRSINKLYLIETLHSKPKIAYVFSGLGGQWFGMGRHLIANEPIFKNSIEEINILLKDIAGWSLIKEMSNNKVESLINKTEIVQSGERSLSCVSIEYHSLKFNLSGKKISSWETVTAQFGIGIFHFAVICLIAQKTNLNKAFSLVKAPLVLVYFLT